MDESTASEDGSDALAQLAERMRLAQEAGGIGIHDYDILTGTIEWDARVAAIWGTPPDEPVSYEAFAAGVHSDDLPEVERAVAAACDPDGDGRYKATYRVRHRNGSERWVEATGIVHFNDARKAARMVGTIRDVSGEMRARNELIETRRFNQHLIETAPTLLYIYDLVEQRNVYIGPQIAGLTGMTAQDYARLDSSLLAALIHPDDLDRVVSHHQAIREEKVTAPFEIEYRLLRADGSYVWLSSIEVVHERDADGRPSQILGASLDVTARHELAADRELLLGELTHRIGNAISLVHAIASLSLRPSAAPDAWRRFESWVAALAAAQRHIGTDQSGTDLEQLITAILRPFEAEGRKRIIIGGPAVQIEQARSGHLSLALHELATNALKHGALSVEDGTVEVTWQPSGDKVDLFWSEQGGPPAIAPAREGFGSKLLKALSPGRNSPLEFTPQGLRCRLRA